MTAEIAIINRNAVILAADSAVTITVRNSDKVYNSADKLFELSTHDPIGIMIYNNLEFMGIAWDVAIRKFRDEISGNHFLSIKDAADAFFAFLLNKLAADAELQKQHVQSILSPIVAIIPKTFATERYGRT